MDNEMESPMLPDSATHKLPNGETVSVRSSPEHDGVMPSLSPQPAAGNRFYGDQARKAEAISRAVLGSSGSGLDGNFKNLIASFLRKMPGQGFNGGHPNDDSELVNLQERCILGDRKLNTDANSGNSMHSDGSSEDTKELVLQSRSYSAARSPCMEGRAGTPAAEVKYSVDFGRGEQRQMSPYQNYLNPLRKMHKVSYNADAQQDFDAARFDNSASMEFQSTSLEDNPLAAMLQKYAVVNGNDRFSMTPQKASGAVPGSSFPLNGLPKKRPFNEEMLHAPAYGQPSMQPGPGGLALNGYNNSADDAVFVCHACSFMARSDEEFQMHLKSHYDYYCQECGYHSRTKGRLDRHMKTFHGHGGDQMTVNPDASHDGGSSPHNQSKANEPKTFKCRQCGFISYSREEHWSHNKIHIKVEKQLKCQFCSFVTEFKHHLEYHLRNHKGLKPFKCTKCNYSCVNKSMLNSHMKSHTNIYQFRCASCKYATKYSHSLKLHLINKKHVPAVVLNPDGSLPKDGSGNFELMSKRGPPRGPRGPRKLRHPSKSVSPPALMPVFPTSAAPVMPFSQGNDFSWVSSLGSQPLNGGALSASLPPMSMSLPSASVQSLAYPLSLLSQLSSTMMPSLGGSSYYPVDRMPGMAPPSIQCSFCNASFGSPHLLAQHVKREHVERLNSFGVKLEARSPVHEAPATTEPDSYQQKRWSEANPSDETGSYFSMSSSTKPRISGDATTVSRFSKDQSKPDSLPNPQNTKRKNNSEMESSAECPLDLSARQSEDAKKPAVKIGAGEPDDLHNNISPSLAIGSAAASRKRSRKGKACKLDMISLTLQDNWEEEECPVEGSEASSFDSDCQPGHEGPHGNNEVVDNGSWDWRKESPRPSDAADGDRPHSNARQAEHNARQAEHNTRGGEHNARNGNASDQEPVSESLGYNDSASKGSDGGLTRHVSHSEKIVRETPGKEYNMCQHCGMGFKDIVTYSLHMGYHGYNDPFQCNMCGHRAEDPVAFFVHIARVAHE